MTCNKSSHNGPIEPGMVSFERLASSPVGNAQFPLFWRIKEPQKGIFLSSPWESRQILPQKVDGQKLLYLYGFRSQLSVRSYFKTRNIKDRKLHSIAQTLPVLESFVKAREKDLDN